MKKVLYLISIFCLCGNVLSAKEYHVSVKGSDADNGDISSPFKTINWAAQKALPGDTVTVHNGTYREWVNPLSGGEWEGKRILYRVADGEKAEIKGSELVTNWRKEKKAKGVWKVVCLTLSLEITIRSMTVCMEIGFLLIGFIIQGMFI